MNRRQVTYVGAPIVACILCWFFPLFHVRSLGTAADKIKNTEATSKNQVPKNLKAYVQGTLVTELWHAGDKDLATAQKQYGRQAGLGGAWYFSVQGQGTVQSVANQHVVLSIDGSPRTVRLELGAVVDNTVRESVGVKASQFANSQEFNAFSTELNRQVEEDVIAPNRELLQPGAVVKFVGCSKLSGKSDLDPLSLVPIQIDVQRRATESSHAASQASGDVTK